jgi:hypothetical protein
VANVFDGIDDQLRGWIARQRLFFVGTAPLAGDGHVNVSPNEKRLRTKGRNGFLEYQREKNAKSIDGLPALEV